MDNYCHVGDVVYGKVTEILSDNCVSDEFYIVNNGVWTVGNCEAEFEICIDMTGESSCHKLLQVLNPLPPIPDFQRP